MRLLSPIALLHSQFYLQSRCVLDHSPLIDKFGYAQWRTWMAVKMILPNSHSLIDLRRDIFGGATKL